jgi:hypothetical protein
MAREYRGAPEAFRSSFDRFGPAHAVVSEGANILIGIGIGIVALVWRYNARGYWSRLFSWWLFALGLTISLCRVVFTAMGYD